MSDIFIRHGNHWRKAQRRPSDQDPRDRREEGPKTLDSLLDKKRKKPPWK
jgi:hypothetical protein